MTRLSVFAPSVAICMNVSSVIFGPAVVWMRTSRRFVAALCRSFARDAFVGDDHQRVAGRRNVGETHDLDRNRGAGLLHLLAAIVEQRTDLAVRAADDDDVADAQRAVLHEHGRDRAASAIERRFDDDGGRATILVRLEIENVGFEQHGFEQLIDARAVARGNRNHFDFAAPIDGLQTLFGQLRLDLIRVGVAFVDLVDRNDDRHARGTDVADRFDRLRHDAVVGRDDEDRDVGDFRTACTHRRERFVTGRIDEGDLAIVFLDRVRTDALRDAAGFAPGNVGLPNLVEQRRLAVVDVTEHRDDRRPRGEQLRTIFFLLDDDFFAGFFDERVKTELLRDGDCRFGSECFD